MSAILKLPRDQVEAIRSRDVQLYLTSRGWIIDPEETSAKAAVFVNPACDGAEITAPSRRDLGDYTLRMADVVLALAAIERRPAWDVLHDLHPSPEDA